MSNAYCEDICNAFSRYDGQLAFECAELRKRHSDGKHSPVAKHHVFGLVQIDLNVLALELQTESSSHSLAIERLGVCLVQIS